MYNSFYLTAQRCLHYLPVWYSLSLPLHCQTLMLSRNFHSSLKIPYSTPEMYASPLPILSTTSIFWIWRFLIKCITAFFIYYRTKCMDFRWVNNPLCWCNHSNIILISKLFHHILQIAAFFKGKPCSLLRAEENINQRQYFFNGPPRLFPAPQITAKIYNQTILEHHSSWTSYHFIMP